MKVPNPYRAIYVGKSAASDVPNLGYISDLCYGQTGMVTTHPPQSGNCALTFTFVPDGTEEGYRVNACELYVSYGR